MDEGIYPDLSTAEYDEIDAIRSTTVKMMHGRTPAHVRYALDHPTKETEALDVGTAVHIAILEPDTFKERVIELDVEGPFKLKAKRLERDAFLARHADAIVLQKPAYASVKSMRDAVHGNPLAHRLLTGEGQNELTLVWDDRLGVKCKARIDRITEFERWFTMIDLKTTRVVADEDRLGREAATYGWGLQQAFYMRGVDALFGPRRRQFYFIITEKDPPHLTRVVQLDEEDASGSRSMMELHLNRLSECMRDNNWPGWESEEAATIRLPQYHLRDLT
jgi:exodeoxyribonuclease VIII